MTRDVDTLRPALLRVTLACAWAAWRPSRELVIPLAAAWSVAALLHATYHSLNLGGFGAGDAIALVAVLVAALVLPVLAIAIARGQRRPTHV